MFHENKANIVFTFVIVLKARSIFFIMINLWYFTDSFMSKGGRGGVLMTSYSSNLALHSVSPNSPFDFTIPGSAPFIWIPIKL